MRIVKSRMDVNIPVEAIRFYPRVQKVKDHKYTYYDYFCPGCGGMLCREVAGDKKKGLERCPRCGQAINWSATPKRIRDDLKRKMKEKKDADPNV